MLALREEEAHLLGYAAYADLKLDTSMAKTPAAATDLMKIVWSRALQRAQMEEADIAALVLEEGP